MEKYKKIIFLMIILSLFSNLALAFNETFIGLEDDVKYDEIPDRLGDSIIKTVNQNGSSLGDNIADYIIITFMVFVFALIIHTVRRFID